MPQPQIPGEFGLENANISEMIDTKIIFKELFNQPEIRNLISWTTKIALIILIVYVIFKLVSLIKSSLRDKRIKKTHKNTEEILRRLDRIEKKLGIKEKKDEEKVKEDKKK